MRDTPLISVIVPIYNSEKYIHKCVDSILSQTYNNLEIILVDDGSTDQSPNICDTYAMQDSRIKVIKKQKEGISVARNVAIKIARGEYISFVDSDDWVAPEFIETLWQTANKYHSPISSVGRYSVFADGTRLNFISVRYQEEKVFMAARECFNSEETLEMLLMKFDRYVTNKLFHVSVFQHALFPEGRTFNDIWILYRLLPHVNKVAVYNVPLYYYNRQNESSVSIGKFRISMLDYFKHTAEFMREAKTFKTPRMLRKLQRDRLAHICGFFKRMMNSDFNDGEVIKPLQRELRYNLWLLLAKPRPLSATVFGVACAISFPLTKQIFLRLPKRIKGF